MAWDEAYLRINWHLDPSSRLSTIHRPKIGRLLCPLFGEGELSLHLTQCRLGLRPRPTSVPSDILIRPAVWPQQTWPKIGEGCTPFCGSWASSNTMSPGSRPASIRSGIHPTVWPQYTNVTYRTDRQTGQTTVYTRSPEKRRNRFRSEFGTIEVLEGRTLRVVDTRNSYNTNREKPSWQKLVRSISSDILIQHRCYDGRPDM